MPPGNLREVDEDPEPVDMGDEPEDDSQPSIKLQKRKHSQGERMTAKHPSLAMKKLFHKTLRRSTSRQVTNTKGLRTKAVSMAGRSVSKSFCGQKTLKQPIRNGDRQSGNQDSQPSETVDSNQTRAMCQETANKTDEQHHHDTAQKGYVSTTTVRDEAPLTIAEVSRQMLEMQEAHRKQMNEMSSLIRTVLIPHSDSDFGVNVVGSSTPIPEEPRRDHSNIEVTKTLSESLSSMLNPLSLAWAQLGECSAGNGEDIQITDYECWRKRFEIQMRISNIIEPMEKQKYFDLWAGHKLSLIVETAPDVPGATEVGYELTVLKLNQVFRGRSSNFSLQQELRTTKQKQGETNVSFLNRLMTSALRIWDRTSSRIHEEILHAVTQNSSSTELRRFAYMPKENTQSGKSYEDLVGQARILDAIAENVCPDVSGELFNLNEVRVGSGQSSSFNANRERNTSRYPSNYSVNQRNAGQNKSVHRLPSNLNANQRFNPARENPGSWRSDRIESRNLGGPRMRMLCNRCGNTNHESFNCFHKDKKCHSCGSVGHLQAMCNRFPSTRQSKSNKRDFNNMTSGQIFSSTGQRSAKISKTENVNSVNQEVEEDESSQSESNEKVGGSN